MCQKLITCTPYTFCPTIATIRVSKQSQHNLTTGSRFQKLMLKNLFTICGSTRKSCPSRPAPIMHTSKNFTLPEHFSKTKKKTPFLSYSNNYRKFIHNRKFMCLLNRYIQQFVACTILESLNEVSFIPAPFSTYSYQVSAMQ